MAHPEIICLLAMLFQYSVDLSISSDVETPSQIYLINLFEYIHVLCEDLLSVSFLQHVPLLSVNSL
jgi:hypothetical protein